MFFGFGSGPIRVSRLGYHGFGVFDKAVRLNEASSVSHDHVKDSRIVAPACVILARRANEGLALLSPACASGSRFRVSFVTLVSLFIDNDRASKRRDCVIIPG